MDINLKIGDDPLEKEEKDDEKRRVGLITYSEKFNNNRAEQLRTAENNQRSELQTQ